MKQVAKKVIRKITPKRVMHEMQRPARIEQKLHDVQAIVSQHDNRVDRLKALVQEVEPYQPTYGITGILAQEPRRSSLDRCRAIEQHLGNVGGLSMLDIGSSLGFVCYYFADRGAIAEGWDSNPKNAEVSRLVGDINGIQITIKSKIFDEDTVKTIPAGTYDVVTILSVLHHVIHAHGVEYTQKLMKELLERVPTVIVELAKKGEDPKLFWDKAQPEDELAIFDLVKKDVTIKEIGSFPNHLSDKTRPLYAVTLKKK